MRVRRSDTSDTGLTLTELMIAMSIFMAVLTLFATAIVNFTSAATKTVQISDQGTDARSVYNLFDRSVRSAEAINRPQRTGNNVYVEWLTTVTSPELCTQWVFRIDTNTLAVRTWVPVASGTTTPSQWRTVEVDVVNTLAQPPFVFTPATMTSPMQRLGLNLYFSRTTQDAATVLSSDFVALNSSISATSNPDVNLDGVSDKEVCTDITGRRP